MESTDGKKDHWIEINGMRFTPDQVHKILGNAGIPIWLLPEAIASVRLDRDQRAQTHMLDERDGK